MDSKKPIYKFKTFWVLFLFLLYSTLGFFAVPYFIKKQLAEVTISELNSKISIDNVDFNPFTIATNLNGIKLKDTDTTLWLSAESIHVNVNLWDTLFDHLSFDKLQINKPHYYLFMDNSSQIKYPIISPSEPSADDSQLQMDIDLIDINKGAINYNDSTSEKQVNLDLREIRFHHDSFTTLDSNNLFSLSFVTVNNEKAAIDGSFNLAQSSYDIKWSIDSFATETVFHLIGDSNDSISGIKNKTGNFNAKGALTSQSEDNKLPSLSLTIFELKDFTNETENAQQLSASISNLTFNNTDIDLNSQSISIESINSDAVNLSVSFDKNNNLVFNQTDTLQASDGKASSEWNYSINTINTKNSVLKLNKIKSNNTNSNVLAFESIHISNLTNLENQITDIVLNSKVDSEGLVKIQSKLNLEPFELTNNITVDGFNLSKWQAWIPDEIQLEISSGLLSLEQELSYKNNDIISNGWFKFNDLELKDQNKQPFFSVNQLDLKQTTIDSLSKKISLGSIVLGNAQGDVIVSEEKQLNINNIVPTSDSSDDASEENDWVIDIKEVEIIDAQTSLTDKSIKPNYHTELSKINGKIKGLSSSNLSKADINLSGLLDTYGKLKIDGQINPLSEKAYTDISINIENLSLENFSSYSGQFLGFPITRGKVDFDLNYKLNESLLKGINDITFKQLQFGDKTPSKDAISLPLKLAVSLLTDGKGIMKINLPVSGNIEDPEFSYGGIVFKAFFKLITGIVASPFKLLGKLIPGGAELDLSGIQFQAGTTNLEQQELAKLEAMKNILKQRPGILLELSGVANTINDTKALQIQQLLTQLNWQEKPAFTADYPIATLQTHYISTFGDEKWQLLLANATKDEILNNEILANNTWDELLQNVNTEEKLSLLAKNRSLYIQAQLIENYSVPVEKIFIKPNQMSEDLYPQVKFGVAQ